MEILGASSIGTLMLSGRSFFNKGHKDGDIILGTIESSEKAPLSGCYEIFGVPHLDEVNGPKGANPQLFEAVRPSFEDLVSKS